MAARGARAAGAMPVIGFLSSQSPDPSANSRSGIPPGPERNRVYRRSKRGDRIPLGGRPLRPAAGAGGRIGSPSGGGDRRERPACGARRQGSNLDAFRSFSPVASTRSSSASLPASTGPAAMSRASASSALRWRESAWSCCTSWFPTPP